MAREIRIRKGVDIKLQGEAKEVYSQAKKSVYHAVKPTDFHNLTPKMIVKEGEKVKAGTILFYDKYNPNIKFSSPVSGQVAEIVRGEKRKILAVTIQTDAEIQYEAFPKVDPNTLDEVKIKETILNAGIWPFIRQRPYAIIADPKDRPKSIFISGFKSGPLAPKNEFILTGNEELFQVGLDAIAKLTSGKVHFNIHSNQKKSSLSQFKGVETNTIKGPHPSGNVGVQIHHIDPINKGDIIWTMDAQNVLTIGALFRDGKLDATRVVALTGPNAQNPSYYKVIYGCSLNAIVDTVPENSRIISGNALTGSKTSLDGYLGFYDDQITILKEGNKAQFFGWMAPNFHKFSLSRTFFSFLTPNKKYDLNTNLNGEHRAFVVTGQYEKVFPMDIYPVQLIKSMMYKDIDEMENLGIYEVAPEDFALCEYVCTSKTEVQHIVREGLDLVKKECG